jgi:hypothetical protein
MVIDQEAAELLLLLNDSEDKVEFGPPINDAIATGMTKAASRTLPKEALDAYIQQKGDKPPEYTPHKN